MEEGPGVSSLDFFEKMSAMTFKKKSLKFFITNHQFDFNENFFSIKIKLKIYNYTIQKPLLMISILAEEWLEYGGRTIGELRCFFE